jgi:hypothetical protein
VTAPSLATHASAIVSKLEAAGLVVGDAGPPTVEHGYRQHRGWTAYAIVYPLTGGQFDGSLEAVNEDADLLYQVTCVAGSRATVQALEDAVNAALLPGVFTIDGRSVMACRHESTGNPRRDASVNPPAFLSTPRYRLSTTPA